MNHADLQRAGEPKPSGALAPGILIAVEGIDGAGKTTQVSRVAQTVRDAGYDVVTTREPTDGPWGQRIRASATAGRMTPEDELDAFLQDRVEHVGKVIVPSLAAGKIVIVDRYYFSSVAYQGSRGMSPGYVLRCNEAIAPCPDLLVLLELDARDGVSRVSARGSSNLFEREDDLRRVAAIYATIERPRPMRIDAMRDANDITSAIIGAVLELARARGITPRR